MVKCTKAIAYITPITCEVFYSVISPSNAHSDWLIFLGLDCSKEKLGLKPFLNQ